MITLTDSAASAIRSLTSQADTPEETGLRIMRQEDGAQSLQIALTDGPAAGDAVVESEGARLFVEPGAAAVLEDKTLDAQVDQQGSVAFRIRSQQEPPI